MKRKPYQHIDHVSNALFLLFLILSGVCVYLIADILANY